MRNAAKRCMFHVEHARISDDGVFHVEQIVVRLGYRGDYSHFGQHIAHNMTFTVLFWRPTMTEQSHFYKRGSTYRDLRQDLAPLTPE